jgi:hypothetical protein
MEGDAPEGRMAARRRGGWRAARPRGGWRVAR